MMLTNQQAREEVVVLNGTYDVVVEGWKPYVRLYGEPPPCAEEAVKGGSYYVVKFSDPLCVFLYNTSLSTTLRVGNYTLTTQMGPVALPGYAFKARLEGKAYQDSIVALYRFQPVGQRGRWVVPVKVLEEEKEYIYSIPFEERAVLEGIQEEAIKDIVLVENSSAYASTPGVVAVGEGYVVVERNITNPAQVGIEGVGVPSILTSKEPIEALENYTKEVVSLAVVYSDGELFLPPTPYQGEVTEEMEVEGFLSGNVFLEVYGLFPYREGNATAGQE